MGENSDFTTKMRPGKICNLYPWPYLKNSIDLWQSQQLKQTVNCFCSKYLKVMTVSQYDDWNSAIPQLFTAIKSYTNCRTFSEEPWCEHSYWQGVWQGKQPKENVSASQGSPRTRSRRARVGEPWKRDCHLSWIRKNAQSTMINIRENAYNQLFLYV